MTMVDWSCQIGKNETNCYTHSSVFVKQKEHVPSSNQKCGANSQMNDKSNFSTLSEKDLNDYIDLMDDDTPQELRTSDYYHAKMIKAQERMIDDNVLT